MKLTTRLRLLLALLGPALVVGSTCRPNASPSSPSLRVREDIVATIVVTSRPDGTTLTQYVYDPERVGRKEVLFQFSVSEPVELRTVRFTYWRAGNNTGAETIVREWNAILGETDGEVGTNYRIEIPDADELDVCDTLYYMWTLTWKGPDERIATYIGSPKRIMPTKRVSPDGTIELALCIEPPGPDV